MFSPRPEMCLRTHFFLFFSFSFVTSNKITVSLPSIVSCKMNWGIHPQWSSSLLIWLTVSRLLGLKKPLPPQWVHYPGYSNLSQEKLTKISKTTQIPFNFTSKPCIKETPQDKRGYPIILKMKILIVISLLNVSSAWVTWLSIEKGHGRLIF